MTQIQSPRWVLVTGAARRLGRAIALDMAQAGWNVVVHYHHSQTEAAEVAEAIQDMGRAACLAEMDMQNLQGVRSLIPALTRELGPLAALVNNASLFEPDTMDPDGARHHAINLAAPNALSAAFLESLPANAPTGAACIVNMLDSSPFRMTFAHYNCSKIALAHETRAMALRAAPRMRVNGVAPGRIIPSPRETERCFNEWIEGTPLGVRIAPESVAAAVRFLIENPAITGEIIRVDGGAHVQKDAREK